ncbi:MAG: hypothetical protein ACREOU_08230 [Candidatus Eiseniibacteriota bacterium]
MRHRARRAETPSTSATPSPARLAAPAATSIASVPPWLVATFVLAARVVYALSTRYAIDDAFITARYGRNLARGLGFAFNEGASSYGFTSPFWVVVAALGTPFGAPQIWLGSIAIAFDVATVYLAARAVPSRNGRLALGALLAAWPVLNGAAAGGMEAPVLSFLAILWWTSARAGRLPTLAAALAPLVRPEGWFLTVAHLVRERRPAALLALLPGLAWFGAAWTLFGSPFPLSAQAKVLLQGGPNPDNAVMWLYHLAQFPLFQFRPLKTSLVVSSISYFLVALALSRGGRGWGTLLLGAWFVFLVGTGAPVFEWYLAVPSLLLIVSACRADALERWTAGALALVAASGFLYVWAIQDGIAQQRLLTATWGRAAEFARTVPGARSVLAEAVGVLGWRYEGTVYDEVGIVTPQLLPYRKDGDGWYYRAVRELEPDLLIIRPWYLYNNQPIAGAAKPFASAEQFDELGRDYAELAQFSDSSIYATQKVNSVVVIGRQRLNAR